MLINQNCSLFFLLHLLVQWELLDAKFHALGAVTVLDLCRLCCVHIFFSGVGYNSYTYLLILMPQAL